MERFQIKERVLIVKTIYQKQSYSEKTSVYRKPIRNFLQPINAKITFKTRGLCMAQYHTPPALTQWVYCDTCLSTTNFLKI